jgi:hypothetical protein
VEVGEDREALYNLMRDRRIALHGNFAGRFAKASDFRYRSSGRSKCIRSARRCGDGRAGYDSSDRKRNGCRSS